MTKTIKLVGKDSITVTLNGYSGTIESTLKDEENEPQYNSAIDGLESLILAQACAGIDIETPQYLESVEVAVNAIVENWL